MGTGLLARGEEKSTGKAADTETFPEETWWHQIFKPKEPQNTVIIWSAKHNP